MRSKIPTLSRTLLVAIAATQVFVASPLSAEVPTKVTIEAPNRKHLYAEDIKLVKRQKKKTKKAVRAADKPASQNVDVKAGKAEFLKDTNQIRGTEGVVISREGIQVQSSEALVNMTTKDSDLKGNVVLSDNEGGLVADSGTFNIDSERGKFQNSQFSLEEGDYDVHAEEAEKLTDVEYLLSNSTLSTCQCSENDKPWRLHSRRSHITEEGYAHTYDTWMDFHGVPIFYTPYLAFPVKRERASGLLAGDYGYSRQDGVTLKLPVFLVLDESTDITVSPFLQSKTRVGSVFDYRQVFSKQNRARGRLLYSNDSARDNSLRGTVTSDIYNPDFNTNRVGGYYSQRWTSAPDADQSWAFLANIHLVNDNLFLREFDDDLIGAYNSRYTTSTLIGRAGLGDFGVAELSGEYNQALVSNPDLTFQRLPEGSVSLLKSFRPFGSNPYGLKLVAQGDVDVTRFSRSTGYDGWRSEITPHLGIPFHVKNYVNGQLDLVADQTNYNLNDTSVPGSARELDSTNDRQLHAFSYRMGTGVERVFELDRGNWLTSLTSLGQQNQDLELLRLKHTIEPLVSYTYIPDVNQDDLPVFDSRDRVRARKLVTYGFRSNLLGRFLPRHPGQDSIPELTPRVEDLPQIPLDKPMQDLDSLEDSDVFGGNVAIRTGEIRPLISFGMKQSYDFDQRNNEDPADTARPLSDLNSDLTLYPSRNFALRFENNFSTQDQTFTSWGLSMHFRDDRGDALRARYSFIGSPSADANAGVSQLEGNAEIALTQQLKFGYYSRYDNRAREFIEQNMGMRLYSQCNCWHMDLGVSDKINPDRQYFNLSVTFSGLGDVVQRVGMGKNS